MIEIKLILCPLDFSEFSIRAYRHAVSLAEHYRAKLVAQHIVEIGGILPPALPLLQISMTSIVRRFAGTAKSNCRNS